MTDDDAQKSATEALRTLRRFARGEATPAPKVRAAIDLLDNLGTFTAIDVANDYEL